MKYKALFFGDVYLNRNHDNVFVDPELFHIIQGYNIVSCNFEAPIDIDSLRPISKVGPHMKQSILAANAVRKTGFNVINLANNHIYDYGRKALEKTLESFKSEITVGAGLDFQSAYKLKCKELQDLRVGFLSFCESEFGALINESCGRGGYAWVNFPAVDSWIAEAKKKVDILIVQVHAGVEEIKIPLPEWRTRYKQLISAGSDAVIAHHPHVPQGWELYQDKLIVYSLGNFCFDSSISDPLWNLGYGVSLTFDQKSIVDFEIMPIENINGTVKLNKSLSFTSYLQEISALLVSDQYSSLVDSLVVSLWDERYKSYYRIALNSSEDVSWQHGFKIFLRSLIKYKKKNNYLFLLHNLRIESHRWCVERALSILEETSNELEFF